MRIDFTGVQDGFEAIPEDDYDCVLSKWEIIKESKNSGKPYVSMEYTITEGEYEGRKLWANRSLQSKSLFAIKRDLIRLGAPENMLEGEIDIEEVLESVEGAECRLRVGQYTYEEELRNDVKEVRSPAHAF